MIHTYLFSIVSFIFIIFSNIAQAQLATKIKEKYNYSLYLPKNYETSDTLLYPLVIYLHGGSQRGDDLNKLKAYGPPYMVDKGHEYNFIIASPQCPEDRYWTTNDWFDLLYSDLKTKYRIDPKRVYLTGISIGGYGTWHTAMDYPDIFAAIVPLCGGVNDTTQICKIKDIPTWTFHGTADDAIPIEETQKIVDKLRQCHGNIKFTALEKEGHGIQYLYEKNEIFEWLLKQHK